ncbi:protein GVQW3-like [Mya arenaria]|uniref:protein GVQW3-like n=1 Tax=Mya arenaria TaxID=6604 RepID=UPI0022E51669|nr:protein GVQW3-like [Mya arenaria]
MNEASSETPVKRTLVYKWHKRFSEGRGSICGDVRSGRPVSQTTESDVKAVKNIVDADRRVTLHEICKMLDMSNGSVRRIMKDSLKMSRASARWVRRLLTEDEMSKRLLESRRFLVRYEKKGNRFLEKIVTCDETWLFYYDPKTKQQSSQWKTTGSPPLKKARSSNSIGKHMFIVFFDVHGVILLHAIPQG